MTRLGVESIVQALNEAGVRYLIAGGLAVVAHGHLRLTFDVDLIVDLSDEVNARLALKTLEQQGYQPRLPVRAEEFADSATRERWIREKGMLVFSMINPHRPETTVDLFVQLPFDFAEGSARALRVDIGSGLLAPFVGLEDLLAMKRRAGRSVDREDIAKLEALKRDLAGGES